MPKSKYPNNIDTSIEIPAVRDNIIEVGSDVLNSLRSAVFQVERTLGVNPQGSAGSSVADRLNRSLDGNGNILKSALDRAGILSGPISDNDISKKAGIKESKLVLDYPTQLLQDEISQISHQLDRFIDQFEALSSIISSHIHPDATNRHYGKAISITSIGSSGSSTATISKGDDTAQGFFEELYSSHINFDGSDISITNRSHNADQVFFDKDNVSAYVSSDDVQNVLEEIVGLTQGALDEHRNKFHENGIARSIVSNDLVNDEEGKLVLDYSDALYFDYDPTDTTAVSTITLSEEQSVAENSIEKSDIVHIIDNDTSLEYQVLDSNESGGLVTELRVFGRFTGDSTSSAQVKLAKNKNQKSIGAGLLVSVREDAGETSAKTIQVSNPDSAAIVSNGCRPSEVTTTNRYIKIVVDEIYEESIDIYDGDHEVQTIDTIIKKINDHLTSNAIYCLAYRMDSELGGSEIAIVHDIPSSSTRSHTLMIKEGDDAAIHSIGFSDYEDVLIDSQKGNYYYIQGQAFEGLGKKMEEVGLSIIPGTSSVTSADYNFLESEISDWDNLTILDSSDDGTYSISSVTSGRLVVDTDQVPSGFLSTADSAIFTVYKNTFSFDSLTFDEVSSSSAASVVDIFMDKDRNIFGDKRLVYAVNYSSSSEATFSIVDFFGDLRNETLTIEATIDSASGSVILSLNGGQEVEIGLVKDAYREIYSGTNNVSLKLFIKDVSVLYAAIDAVSTDMLTFEVESKGSVNYEENLLLARVHYESQRGRVTGAGSSVPRVFSKLNRGTLGYKDLSVDARMRMSEQSVRDMRTNGVVRGLEISESDASPLSDDGHHVIGVKAGVCYVMGRRFEIDSIDSLSTGLSATDVDKFFVAIDSFGNIIVSPADGASCACTLDSASHCILGSVEWDGVSHSFFDLRLFIDNLDLTVLNSITVSPQDGMGHFKEIGPALKYAKRFSEVFPDAGVPTVHLKSGVHKAVINTGIDTADVTANNNIQHHSDYGLYINFPVNITGEGHSTVLDFMRVYNDKSIEDDDRTDSGNPYCDAFIIIAGPGLTSSVPSGNSDKFESGTVRLSNFRMRLSSVVIYDPKILDSAGNKANWSVIIDNVIFDQSEKEVFDSWCYGVLVNPVDTAAGDLIGNIHVSSCSFLNSHFRTYPYNAEDHKNISITNNIFRGRGVDSTGGEGNYAIYIESGSLFDFDLVPASNNICISDNILADFDSSSGSALIDNEGEVLWGDRAIHSLYIPKKLGVGTSTPDQGVHVYGKRIRIGEKGEHGNETSQHERSRIEFYANKNGAEVHALVQARDSASTKRMQMGTVTSHDLELFTGNSTRILIEDTGNIGIGTTSPTSFLDVRGDTNIEGSLNVSDGGIDVECPNEYSSYALDLKKEGVSSSLMIQLENKDASGTDAPRFGIYHLDDGSFSIGESWDDEKFKISPNGDVSIPGTITTDTISGNIDADGVSGNWTVGGCLYAEGSVGGWSAQFDDNVLVKSQESTQHTNLRIDTSGWDKDSRLELWENGNERWALYNDGSNNRFVIKNEDDNQVLFYLKPGGGLALGNTTSGMPDNTWGQGIRIKQQDNSGTDGISFEGAGSMNAWTLWYADNGNFRFAKDSNGDGTYDYKAQIDDAGNAGVLDFTGQHRSMVADGESLSSYADKIGMIVVSSGEYYNFPVSADQGFEVPGNKPQINESLPKVTLSIERKQKSVFGVISEIEDLEPTENKAGVRSRMYLQGAWCSIFEAPEGDDRLIINSLGEGAVWICNINGNLENGDYITSCEVPGYGMKQDDDLLHNYTVAKITQDCDFDLNSNNYDCVEFEFEGQTYRKAFVGCTYHCG